MQLQLRKSGARAALILLVFSLEPEANASGFFFVAGEQAQAASAGLTQFLFWSSNTLPGALPVPGVCAGWPPCYDNDPRQAPSPFGYPATDQNQTALRR